MSARFDKNSEPLICESCRKPLGKAQLACPRRELEGEQGCAYLVDERPLAPVSGPIDRIFQIISGLLVLVTLVSPWLLTEDKGVVRDAAPWVTGAGVVLLILWVSRIFGRKRVIENPVSGQMLVQTMVLGLELNRIEIAAIVPEVWHGSPAREMRYPASVVELYREGNAADLISTALLQLMAEGVVQIGVSRVRRRIGRSYTEYRVLGRDDSHNKDTKGELERRIHAAVGECGARGLRITELVVTLLDGGQQYPRNFLVETIVGPEAETLGLGEVRGNLRKALVPAPNTVGRVARDIQSLEMLYRDFWVMMPDHAHRILAEIDRVILLFVRTG